jgi:hypothetical protein
MNEMSKFADAIWYGPRPPARCCAAALNASSGNGHAGSTGRCDPLGGAAPSIFFSAVATTAQTSATRTIGAPVRLRASFSSKSDESPITAPAGVNAGPPALPRESRMSATMPFASTLVSVPGVNPFGCRIGTPIAKISSPLASVGAGCVHASGIGRIDATAAGSIRSTATSRAASAARTAAATLIAGVTCTSIAVAVPTARWLVAISPFASMTNPDARAVGVHSAKTLSSHCGRTTHGSVSTADVAATFSTSAFFAVNSRTASRPAAMSNVRVHWYDLPWNTSGWSDSTV